MRRNVCLFSRIIRMVNYQGIFLQGEVERTYYKSELFGIKSEQCPGIYLELNLAMLVRNSNKFTIAEEKTI